MHLKRALPFLLATVLFLGTTSTRAISLPDPSPEPALTPQKKVAFVIDDLGNNMKGTREILSIEVPLTVAVMPFLPSTKKDAELAYKNGHEVFVHMPMQPLKGKASWLGPGAITTDLSDEEIKSRINRAIDDVPHAIGMNNHMGSKVTQDKRIMRVIMGVLKQRGLIYLDSKTTYKSVAAKVAEEMGVPYAVNQLFLNDAHTVAHITGQMEKVCQRLGQQQSCIVIGHVGPAGKKTASILRQYIPRIQKEAAFVTISKLIHQPVQ